MWICDHARLRNSKASRSDEMKRKCSFDDIQIDFESEKIWGYFLITLNFQILTLTNTFILHFKLLFDKISRNRYKIKYD